MKVKENIIHYLKIRGIYNTLMEEFEKQVSKGNIQINLIEYLDVGIDLKGVIDRLSWNRTLQGYSFWKNENIRFQQWFDDDDLWGDEKIQGVDATTKEILKKDNIDWEQRRWDLATKLFAEHYFPDGYDAPIRIANKFIEKYKEMCTL